MAVTITWSVTQLPYYPEYAGQTDVVFAVGWKCYGADGNYSYYLYGIYPTTYVAGTPFTPYADLTEQQVLDWIWSDGLNKAGCESIVTQQVQEQINPPVPNPPLPWASQ